MGGLEKVLVSLEWILAGSMKLQTAAWGDACGCMGQCNRLKRATQPFALGLAT